MNWYKIADNAALLDKSKTDIGQNLPPTNHNDDGGDDDHFEPDDKMIQNMLRWIHGEGISLCSRDIINTVLSVEPKIITYRPNKFRVADPFSKVSTSGIAQVRFSIVENEGNWFSLTQLLSRKIMDSSLWKYLGIDYKLAFKYLSNQHFLKYLFAYLVGRCLREGSNFCAFTTEQHKTKILTLIKSMLQKEISADLTNADLNSLEVYGQDVRSMKCQGFVFEGDKLEAGFHLYYNYTCTFMPWKFEQRQGNGFVALDVSTQRGSIGELIDHLEAVAESGEAVEKSQLIGKWHGRYIPATTYDPPEYPEPEVYATVKQFLTPLNSENGNLIARVFATIPDELKRMVRYNFPTFVDAQLNNESEEIEANVILLVQDIKTNGHQPYLVVSVDAYPAD